MKTFYLTLWIFYISITKSSMHNNIKDTITWLKNSDEHSNETKIKIIPMRHFGEIMDDNFNYKVPKKKSNIVIKLTSVEDQKKKRNGAKSNTEHIGTENPWLRRRARNQRPYRRQYKYYDMTSESGRESSTSSEMRHWREEFDLDWVNKKMMAIKEKINTTGAVNVHMAGARPWAVPCGDPNQHDMPWGTCTLPFECEAEFRIFRGDSACGRTKFVCCAVQLTHHDLYQAIDMSFIDTSGSTSEEKRKKKRGSKENRLSKKSHDLNRRRKRKFRLKRTIKKNIRKLARQIRKALNRAFRNATADRRHKTKMLKNEIKKMKKQFYLDRQVAKNLHDFDIQDIDKALQYKLKHIKDLNHNFLMNDTYRDIVMNNNRTALRLLLEAYPQLKTGLLNESVLTTNSSKPTRRSGSRVLHKKKKRKIKDYLEYDIEYGALYY